MTQHVPDGSSAVSWAVIGYSRFWLSIDAPVLARIQKNNGKLDHDTAAEIVSNYRISRTLPGSQSNDFTQIYSEANALEQQWVGSILNRYNLCKALADKWPKLQHKRQDGTVRDVSAISAATKLMWFLHPESWTMYDSFARRGMGASSADTFYCALHHGNFLEQSQKLRKVISAHPDWSTLPATKVIDHFLVSRGRQPQDPQKAVAEVARQQADAQSYLDSLPQCARKSLIDLAKCAQATLGNDFLPAIVGKRRNNK